MAKKTYVLDTSVYLTDADAVSAFKNNDIVIPLKVLEEVDKHKSRQDGVGNQARKFIRALDALREKGSLQKGVRIGKGKGLIRVSSCKDEHFPSGFEVDNPDNQIIGVALTENKEQPEKKVIVVSRDINMRVKCDALGLKAEGYQASQVLSDSSQLYSGFGTCLVDDQEIDKFYENKDVFIENAKFFPNQFIMMVSNANEKKTALGRHTSPGSPLRHLTNGKGREWVIKARNKEQSFALDLLLDENIPVVTLVGRAGSGKTLAAVSAGLEQVLGNGKKVYKKLIVSRPVQPMGKDLGYLPGSLEEKMRPWLAPIRDNLEYLLGDKFQMEEYMTNGTIEIEALTYIRGRSISDTYIIIDEAQNLSKHELKTIITRVGERTKIVLTGDIEQIDNVYIDETSNGLTYAIEKFKHHEIAGHVTLTKGERSKTATLAARIL